jgi:type IV pilus assembly protein PilQ
MSIGFWRMRRWSVGAGLLIVVLLATEVPAQESPAVTPPSPMGREGPARDSLITIDVKDRPATEVLEFIREKAGINLVVDQGIDKRVTLKLVKAPWRKSLQFVVEQADCVLLEQGPNLFKVEKPPRVNFYFDDADVKKVIDAISKIGGANIVVAPEVKGLVNVRLTNVPWRDALDTIVKTLNYTVVEEDRGILRVVSPSSLKEQLFTKAFHLKYIRPNDEYRATLRENTGGGSGGTANEIAFERQKINIQQMGDERMYNRVMMARFPLLRAIRGALSKEGSVDYIDNRNILVVKDNKQVIDEVSKIVELMDIEPGQIFLDVKFVTTRNSNFFDFGIDWLHGFNVFTNGGSIPSRLPFNLGNSGWEDDVIASESESGPFGFPDSDVTGGGSQVTFGRIDFTQTEATLRMLKNDEDSSLVQAPKLVALDNQEATIFVGDTIRYAESTAEQGQAGGLQFTIQEAANSPVTTGFTLFFIPHILQETNKVQLTIIPRNENFSPGTNSNALPGFNTFQIGGLSIDLPQIQSRTLVTKMILESGQTGVIGGLITDDQFEQIRKIPLLGDVPILGWLFKFKRTRRVKDSLIVFITPYLIRSSEDTQKVIDQEMDRRRARMRSEFDKVFGPPESGGATGQNSSSR